MAPPPLGGIGQRSWEAGGEDVAALDAGAETHLGNVQRRCLLDSAVKGEPIAADLMHGHLLPSMHSHAHVQGVVYGLAIVHLTVLHRDEAHKARPLAS